MRSGSPPARPEPGLPADGGGARGPLSIGIACHAGLGGSGILATELGLALARRGHRVHFVGTDPPRRLEPGAENVSFHPVRAAEYPVFRQVPHELALVSALVSLATSHRLDLFHAHYAVPHAAAAWMATEVLGGTVALVTTLHGTDVTAVGTDPSYLPVTRHSVLKSDAVTTPSVYLREETWSRLGLDPATVPIEVIPNFVDTEVYRPHEGPSRPRLAALFGDDRAVPVVAHVSNFREVKRVDRVVDVFREVLEHRPARLILVGDGPERGRAESRVHAAALSDHVRFLGARQHFAEILRECSAFLLPSSDESFGLAALEALSSGVPVVASRVGGLPELVDHGRTGLLYDPDDRAGMASGLVRLMAEPAWGVAARRDVLQRFRAGPMAARYESLYHRVLRSRGHGVHLVG